MAESGSAGLVGRARERQALRDALAAPGSVAQLVGPPGIGKSTLARAVAPDAAWVVAGSGGGLLPTVARALGVPADLAAVRGALGDGALVLDGAESVADEVGPLIDALRGARVLVTTRQRLAGLPLVELGPLGDADATALFLARAAEVGARPEDLAGVAELVRRLEGWPLALELAAGRMRLFAPSELLDEPALALFGDGQGSLSRALEASWALLAPGDQRALARVALFRAPFDRDAFRRVSGARLDALERLMDASLVRWSSVDGGRRYHLLAPIRAFALDRLGDDPDAQAAWAQAVLERAEAAVARSESAEAMAARAELGRSASDLHALRDRGGPVGARAALALAALARAWGPIPDAVRALRAIDRSSLDPELARAVDLGEADLCVRAYDGDGAVRCLARWPDDPTVLRLRGLGELRRRRLDDALVVLERAVAAADAAGDAREMADARYAFGVALLQRGEKWRARDRLREALERASTLDMPDLDGLIRKFLVLVEGDLGLFGAGRRSLAEGAVARHVQSGNLRLEVMARNVAASVAIDEEDPDLPALFDALEARALRAGVQTTAEGVGLMRAIHWLERGEVERATDALAPLGAPGVAIFNATWASALHGVIDVYLGRREAAIERIRAAVDALARMDLPSDVAVFENVLILLGALDPPDLPDDVPVDAPVRIGREVARLTARGEPLPADLEARARRSQTSRMVLALALHGIGTEVSASGAWFMARGERVDLTRRRVLRRVLAALAAQGDRPISHEELLALGWPGEVTTGASGKARVHVAVSDLRRLGLKDDLQTVERDGLAAYRLRARIVPDPPGIDD